MTSPIETQQNPRITASSVPNRTWCCGTPITDPHVSGCAYEHKDEAAPAAESVPEPPAPDSPPESVPAAPSAAEDKPYGFKKASEFDLELPGGGRVRVRKLRKMQVIDLKIMDILDGFGPDLLKDISGDDPERAALAQQEAVRAVVDPATSAKVFAPVNRVLAAAVICPRVVIHGPTTDEQINVDEIEIDDKMTIFNAALPDELKTGALGAQIDALKSVRGQPEAGVRDIRDGEAVLPEAE